MKKCKVIAKVLLSTLVIGFCMISPQTVKADENYDNTNTSVEAITNTAQEEILDQLIDTVIEEDFSVDSLDEVADIASVEVTNIDENTIQYQFSEKENTDVKKSRSTEPEQYKIVSLAVAKSSTGNTGNTEYNGSVKLKAEIYYTKTSVKGSDVYRMLYGTGTVVSNGEKYGKNLNIKVKCAGACTTLSGTRAGKTQGWYTASKASPTKGTTYYNNHSFSKDYYYFCGAETGLLALDVTYQYSHNGSSYYTITSSVRLGGL